MWRKGESAVTLRTASRSAGPTGLANPPSTTAPGPSAVSRGSLSKSPLTASTMTSADALTSGLVFVTLTFVADSLQVGAVLGTVGELDPTMIGGHGEGSILIFGPMARLLTALFLITAASAILGTRLLPAWTARMAQAVAVFHLAMVPSLFSGTLPARFYSINGWNIPVAGGLFVTWLLAASVTLLRQSDAPPKAA